MDTKRRLEERDADRDQSLKKQRVEATEATDEQMPVLKKMPVFEEMPVLKQMPVLEQMPVLKQMPVFEEMPVLEQIPVLSESNDLHENGKPATDDNQSVSIAAESIQTGASVKIERSPVMHEAPASPGEPAKANGGCSTNGDASTNGNRFKNGHGSTNGDRSKNGDGSRAAAGGGKLCNPWNVALNMPEQDGEVRIALNKIVDEALVNFKPFESDLLKQLKSIDTIMKMLSSLFKSEKLIKLSSVDDVKNLAAMLIQINTESRSIDLLLIDLTDKIREMRSHTLALTKQLQNPNEPKTKELQKLIADCEKNSVSKLDDTFKLVKAFLIEQLLKTDSLTEMDGRATYCLFELLILHLSTIFLLSSDSGNTAATAKDATTTKATTTAKNATTTKATTIATTATASTSRGVPLNWVPLQFSLCRLLSTIVDLFSSTCSHSRSSLS